MKEKRRRKQADPVITNRPAPVPKTSPKTLDNSAHRLRAWRLWTSVALIILNLAIYAPIQNHDFVGYDDRGYITENRHVRTGLSWDNIVWAFTKSDQANWHPVTWISHMIDVQMFGVRPGPHHDVNLLLHIVNSLLLFELLLRMTGASGLSAFVAAIFAVHPLHVESVAWAAERKDVLSTLFLLLTLLAYVAYVRNEKRRRTFYLTALVLFALGLMAKPMLVTLPFVMLLLDVWPLQRVNLATLRLKGPGLITEKLPLFALVAASSIVTFFAQRGGGAVYSLDRLGFGVRAANAAHSYLAYIGSMLWPSGLAVFYPFPNSIPPASVLLSLLVLAGITVAAWTMVERRPYFLVGWLWYVGTLVPVIGLVQVGSQARADRYTYVPSIGLLIIAAWGAKDLAERWPALRNALPIVAVGAILACTIVAQAQVKYWQNSFALWTRSTNVIENNYVALGNLGYEYWKQGNSDVAIKLYNDSLRINPTDAPTLSHLGVALASQGKVSEAIAQLQKAIRLQPNYSEAHNNIGPILANVGQLDEAIKQFSEAIRIQPDYADAHNNLGVALARQGKLDEGIQHFFEAVKIQPDYVNAHNNLGLFLAQKGKLDEAIAHYSEVLRLDPSHAQAHYGLGQVYKEQGKIDQAVREFREALRIQPNYGEAAQELATIRTGQVSR
jgi:tetratricopeptide (TPR) repeat protein